MDGLQDQKFNIRLVRTVKKYPVLYNSDLKEYTRRDFRERAWIDVSEELNCDPKPLQKKWQNFRTLLVRKLKQKQMGESVQQYYLYDELKFIIPYLKKSYEPEAIKRTIKPVVDKRDEEAENLYETYTDQSMEENENEIIQGNYSDDPIYLEEDETAHMNLTKRIKASNSSDEEAEICDMENFRSDQREWKLNNASNNKSIKRTPIYAPPTAPTSAQKDSKRCHSEDADNPKKQFVLSLLPDLNEMSNSQMRRFKCKVLHLVDEILKENAT